MSISKTNPPGNKMPRGWNKILYPGWKNIKLYVTSRPAPRTWVTGGVCIHLHYDLWTYHPIDLLRDLLVYITSHQRLGLGVPFNVFLSLIQYFVPANWNFISQMGWFLVCTKNGLIIFFCEKGRQCLRTVSTWVQTSESVS